MKGADRVDGGDAEFGLLSGQEGLDFGTSGLPFLADPAGVGEKHFSSQGQFGLVGAM